MDIKRLNEIGKIPFKGRNNKEEFTFKHYDPNEIVLGKKMKNHLKFAMSYWHTLVADGVGIFGDPTSDKNFKEENLSALIITPIDHHDIAKALKELKIPIVTINNDIDVEKLAFVGCDYHNSGMLAGDLANISLKNGGKVAIIVGSFNVRGHKERIRGFSESFIKGEILTFENQDDDDISYKMTKEIIKNENIDLIYFGAAGIAGGLKALKELHKNIPVITVDETVSVRESLKNSDVLATITQQPYKQGSRASRIVHDYLIYNRKPIQTTELTNNKVILKNSIYI